MYLPSSFLCSVVVYIELMTNNIVTKHKMMYIYLTNNLFQAKEYLQKLEAYKEFGFHEKAVHEAYTKAKADWNEALDILTRDR